MQANQEVSGKRLGQLLDTGITCTHPGPAIHKAFTLVGRVIISSRLGCGDPEIMDLKIPKRMKKTSSRLPTKQQNRVFSVSRLLKGGSHRNQL